jgi:diketogulonate reductase-like aldo/keto reductase
VRHSRKRPDLIRKIWLAGSLQAGWFILHFILNMIYRTIPSTGEKIAAIGMGTWQSFDHPLNADTSKQSSVLTAFREGGGQLIDSSPMYGQSEALVGKLTQDSGSADAFFYATKVWIQGREEGIRQMNESFSKMKRETMDLVQIHNLVDWKTHLKTLRQWKEEGRVRYIGITHYTDSHHDELERIIRQEPLDFVQFNYSIIARNAEKRLLPAAQEKGVATLINRPLSVGELFGKVKKLDVPGWASEAGMKSWSQFFLGFILGHPGVTCVIPATSDPDHMKDNMKAGSITPPGNELRERMASFIARL